MERDAFIAHQARGWLIERYMTVSDETTIYVCPKCELPCIANPQRPLYICEICGNTDPVPPTKVPRSLLLLYGYNAAMGTKIQMRTGPVNKVLPAITDDRNICQGRGCSRSSGCTGIGCPSSNYEDER